MYFVGQRQLTITDGYTKWPACSMLQSLAGHFSFYEDPIFRLFLYLFLVVLSFMRMKTQVIVHQLEYLMLKTNLVRGMIAASLVICSSVWAGSAYAADDQFHLVNGDVRAIIVGDDSIPSAVENGYRNMPHALTDLINKSTGVVLQQISEDQYDPKKYPYAIFTGNTKASRERHGEILQGLDRDAYVVEITPHAVYLVGARSHSNGYATLDFLEKELGIATYIPSRWGTIIPKHKKVILEPSLRVESPVFTSRAFSVLRTYAEKPDFLNYSGNAEIPWRIYRRDAFHHALHTFITVKEFGKTHPEYFPERNGKRAVVSSPAAAGPCISNPDVVRILTQKVIAFFDDPKNKDKDSISLGMTDGGWCECAQCKALDAPDITGNANAKSNRYYWMLNQVADALKKVHPKKSIGVPCYSGAEYPPSNMTVAPNIVPYITQTRANWGDPEVVRTDLALTFAWSSRVDRMGVYEYQYGAGFMVPRIYSHMLAEFLRQVANQGQAGFYAEIYSNHALDGPKAWITEKLLWNPYQDVSALQTHWCNALFNEAAKPMNDYFAFLEDCNRRNIQRCPAVLNSGKTRDSKFYMLQDEAQFNLFNMQEIERAKTFLQHARDLTKDKDILERINYFSDGLHVSELSCKAFHALGLAREVAAQDNATPQKLLKALIVGQAGTPEEDPVSLMRTLTEKDSSMFTPVMPVSISTGTKLSMELINNTSWKAVRAALKQGERDPEKLKKLSAEALLKVAPADWQKDNGTTHLIGTLTAMSDRIAVANRVQTAPVIDGDVSDSAWKWQKNSPWFASRSGVLYTLPTEFAFCYKGNMLYYAFRAKVTDMEKRQKVEGYGSPAWKYVSSEVFLNVDDETKDEKVPYFQFIPALGGGMYASKHEIVKEWKVTHDDQYWQTEVAIDLTNMGWSLEKLDMLRMNIVSNTKESGHYGKHWFPTDYANVSQKTRGWLVLEK